MKRAMIAIATILGLSLACEKSDRPANTTAQRDSDERYVQREPRRSEQPAPQPVRGPDYPSRSGTRTAYYQGTDEVTVRDAGAGDMDSAGFLRDAAAGGRKEIEIGRLAVKRGINARVRQFGQRMVDDHTNADKDLMQVAKKANIDVPAGTSAEQQQDIDQIAAIKGDAFDPEYMKSMVKDHEDAVSRFEDQSRNGTDPDVRAFADRMLPTLRDHLQQAREIAQSLEIKTAK